MSHQGRVSTRQGSTVTRARSRMLARASRNLHRDLIQARRDAKMTQKDVADLLGVTQQAVAKLEQYDADPQLSSVMRYANAVGVLVEYRVSKDEGQSLWQPVGSRGERDERLPSGTVTAGRQARTSPSNAEWANSGPVWETHVLAA